MSSTTISIQENEVKNLEKIRIQFKNDNLRGGLNAYIAQKGGYENVFKIFSGYVGFLSALEKAGYSKAYRSELKRKWQKQFHENKV